ncbi:MAG: protein arginine phosphatase [Moorella sp. (in: firmicutes)]|uniref:Low molecular weight protein-tyrosine-phosphatase YwlE n=1 Tax=Moorella mulderi DSM 14980 TaxID=1122241 RepID=A0A151B160_9FIRM|nr:low molecular weight protein arginine phosphatase [Moorella mulderi]KYH33626.1 Low molecular weight protein-tyrosine-phosphatase YwlE [Moorella mulderi DSM 14980]MDK2816631.1 protein arginine phosphatase [Moorella sp. (in: firmicutes)]MDN5362813.1 protein arginine phosphatase [Moorella sp. (in: firmicutes)]
MPGILFVCTGNTCRSSMAAAIASHIKEERGLDIEIASAGLAAREGDPATPQAIQAVAAMGIDLQDHRARQVTGALVDDAGLILTMTRSHKEYLLQLYPDARGKTFTLKEYVRDGKEKPSPGEPREETGARAAAGRPPVDDDIPDPFGRPLEVYQATARELAELVGQALEKYAQDTHAANPAPSEG